MQVCVPKHLRIERLFKLSDPLAQTHRSVGVVIHSLAPGPLRGRGRRKVWVPLPLKGPGLVPRSFNDASLIRVSVPNVPPKHWYIAIGRSDTGGDVF